ncbi:TPA: hypothetical protein ACG0LC_000195 [Citrobacter sedlakii]
MREGIAIVRYRYVRTLHRGGITAYAEIGAAMAKTVSSSAGRVCRRLYFFDH